MYDECVTTAHSCTYIVLVSPFFFFFLWLFCSTLPRSPSTHCCSTIPKPCLSEPLFDKGCAEIPQAFFFDKATTNCHNVYPVWRSEGASIRREARKSSRYLQMCCIFNVLFKSREIRTLRTSTAIVFPFPAMDVVALGYGLDGHWGFQKSRRSRHGGVLTSNDRK